MGECDKDWFWPLGSEREPDIQGLGVGLFCSQMTLILGLEGNPDALLIAAGEVESLYFNISLFLKVNSAAVSSICYWRHAWMRSSFLPQGLCISCFLGLGQALPPDIPTIT